MQGDCFPLSPAYSHIVPVLEIVLHMRPSVINKRDASFDTVQLTKSGTEADHASCSVGLVGDVSYTKAQSVHNSSDPSLKELVTKWCGNVRMDFVHKKQTYSGLDWMNFVFPCVSWMKGYKVWVRPEACNALMPVCWKEQMALFWVILCQLSLVLQRL
jgi:hypothetical protein